MLQLDEGVLSQSSRFAPYSAELDSRAGGTTHLIR
jgi:hypothetical protein